MVIENRRGDSGWLGTSKDAQNLLFNLGIRVRLTVVKMYCPPSVAQPK
jgi:hypothetical protein